MKNLSAILIVIALPGCGVYESYKKNYTRTIVLVGNASDRGGSIEFETRKADKPGEGSLGLKVRIEGSLADGKQIIGIGR